MKKSLHWARWLTGKISRTLNVTVTGQALTECGESYRQLAEVKYSLEDGVRQNFIEPLLHLQSKDLKEVNVSRLQYKFIWFAQHCLYITLSDIYA